MLGNIAANRSINFLLRGLQLIFAVVVLGTDGYSVRVFRGHSVSEHFEFGDFVDYLGVPNAWEFLLFCAGWTVLGVAFLLVAGVRCAESAVVGYMRVAVEAIALLSWFAGFIAVAVNIGTTTCPIDEHGCGAITAAAVFGALEWLLFIATTLFTVKLVFDLPRSRKSKPGPSPRTEMAMSA